MEAAYFTCQLCRARLTLVGSLDSAPGTESAAWAGGRGLLVPPHLQASVFDHSNVDESFIVLDGKRQGPPAAVAAHGLPPQHPNHPANAQPTIHGPQQSGLPQHPTALHQFQHQHQQQPATLHPHRSLEESFVMLGTASLLRPPPGLQGPGGPGHQHLHPALSPLYLQALQQQLQQQQQQQQQRPGSAAAPGSAGASPPQPQFQSRLTQTSTSGAPTAAAAAAGTTTALPQQQSSPQPAYATTAAAPQPQQPGYSSSPSQSSPLGPGGSRRGGGAGQGGGDADGGGGGSTGGGGGPAGSGLDSKLQALARLFELASTNTQVDHPLCMDCVGQLKEEMDTQIAEAEREIAAYSACLAQLEAGLGGEAGGAREAEEYQLEEISRLEQERDQERARAEVLESELSSLAAELSSLAAASADLASLEQRYWHDVNDFEVLLRAHTDDRGALLAKIDRAGQRLQLLKNTSVLYDAFKIWHDGPFGTISGFRLGRTPEVAVEWDEINAAWGQAVLLLHTMAQLCKVQFSQHRLLPMGSHPRMADKRSTYDLFGPVSKLWSANYDRAMVAYLACLKEFGEHARRKDAQDGKPTQFNFPFAIDGDKVNNHTIKLTLNKDVRWTKALKFMLANLKIALQWCIKQDQAPEAPQLQQLQPEGPQLLPEH